MNYSTLELVVLQVALPEYGLRKGDLGTVVEVYPQNGLEVEFVTASGQAAAIVSVSSNDVRPIASDDLIVVRRFERSPDRDPEDHSD